MKDLGIFFKICKSKLVIGESIIIVKKPWDLSKVETTW